MQAKHPSEAPQLKSLSREAFWQRHVNQWRESQLSKIAYCRRYSLVYHQMVYWCSKAVIDEVVDPKVSSNDFIAVSVTPAQRHSALSIRLPNGIAIEGIDEYSVTLVGKLVEQL